MKTKNSFIVLFAGLLSGVVAAFVLSGAYSTSRAMGQAQPQKPLSSVQRYQLAAWAHPAGSAGPNSGGTQAMHGAYVLDTQGGKVWQITDGGKPELLGSVE
jgi:hypothetical protein